MSVELKEYVKEVGEKESVCIMEHAGFKASLMRAERLKGDHLHGLPPGEKIRVFPIATLPGSPDSWVKEAGTYVVPVDKEVGLWFDWTMNDSLNTAVLPSVKGMNPITGRKIESFVLEEYSDKCPVHDVALTHGNLCSECGYEWPPQNYITKDSGEIWWDGFRQADGSIRQFFFTDEDERDIASAVIGKENTVPAFGFAFYRPKNPRTPLPSVTRGMTYSNSTMDMFDAPMGSSGENLDCCGPDVHYVTKTSAFVCSGDTGDKPLIPSSYLSKSSGESKGIIKTSNIKMKGVVSSRRKAHKKFAKKSKSVSVGGGAKINQVLIRDSLGLDGWQENPSAVIRLYFCFEEQFRQIVRNGGVTEFERNSEGYLEGLTLG